MDQLIQNFQAQCVIGTLEQDVHYIISMFYRGIPSLDVQAIHLHLPHITSVEELYYAILQILDERGEKMNLLEMMPLIDEYIEHAIEKLNLK
jgi:hypothetical protein